MHDTIPCFLVIKYNWLLEDQKPMDIEISVTFPHDIDNTRTYEKYMHFEKCNMDSWSYGIKININPYRSIYTLHELRAAIENIKIPKTENPHDYFMVELFELIQVLEEYPIKHVSNFKESFKPYLIIDKEKK